MHRYNVKMIKNVVMSQNIRNNGKLHRTSKRAKWWVTSQNIQNYAKQRKWSNYDEFASIWRPNDLNCWVTSQNIQINAKLQKWSNYDELHAFDIKTNKNVALGRKPFKTTLNYKSDQSTMTCIDLTSKWSIMSRYFAKYSSNAKLQK